MTSINNPPNGWIDAKLGDISRINPRIDASTLTDEKEVSFLPMRCVEELSGRIDLSITKKFSEVKKGYTSFMNGDLLVAKITPCMENGKAAIAKDLRNGVGFGSTEFHVIRVHETLLEKFVFFYLIQESFRKDAQMNMTGSAGQLRVPSSYLQETVIPIPPVPEQHRIVDRIEELFSRLDAGVEELKKAKVQLQRYRQSVLKAAVEGRLTEAWRKAHPEVEPAEKLRDRILKLKQAKLGRKYKESRELDTTGLPLLPESWLWARLDSLADLKGGITKDTKRKVNNGRKIPYLRVANVQRGYLDLDEIKEIEVSEEIISELRLECGDILFNEGGDRDKLGRGWIWQGELPECIHQNHVFRARLFSNDVSNKFVSWFGNTYGQKYFLKEGKQTTNLASINLTKLSAFPVPLPPREEQDIIAYLVEDILFSSNDLAKIINLNLNCADRLRQSILKSAFEGKLVPQDPNDEPASILLERIKAERTKHYPPPGRRRNINQLRLAQ